MMNQNSTSYPKWVAEMNIAWGESVISTFRGYPILILAVTGAAAALAPLRGLARWHARLLARAMGDGDPGPGPTAHWRVAMLVLCLAFGAISAPFAFAKIVRAGLVSALNVGAGILPKERQTPPRDESESPTEFQLGYCLKIVCRTTGLAPRGTVTWLFSGHKSRRDGWSGHMATSMMSGLLSPGGFCMRS